MVREMARHSVRHSPALIGALHARLGACLTMVHLVLAALLAAGLADLCALEIMPAMKAGTEHKVALEQCAGSGENIEYLLLAIVHGGDAVACRAKNKINFACWAGCG